jgi:hypothetical protein
VKGDDLGGPGGDRLSRVLRHSTIGAKTFDGRVRDGIGSGRLAWATRPAKIIVAPVGRWHPCGCCLEALGLGADALRPVVPERAWINERRSSRTSD